MITRLQYYTIKPELQGSDLQFYLKCQICLNIPEPTKFRRLECYISHLLHAKNKFPILKLRIQHYKNKWTIFKHKLRSIYLEQFKQQFSLLRLKYLQYKRKHAIKQLGRFK